MKISIFIKDKLIFILSQSVMILLLWIMLSVSKIGLDANILICLTVVLITVSALILEYTKKSRYYNRLYNTFDKMDKKQYISSMLEEPDFVEAEILCDILKQTTKAMNDEIAIYKLNGEEYREYIETWIHEIKIPISCIDLICENNKSEVTENIQDEMSRVETFVEQALFYARSTNVEKDYSVREIKLDSLIKKVIKKNSKQLIACKTYLKFENLEYNIYTDPKWLDFIIGQIVSNSIKYKKDALSLSFSACDKGSKIVLSITDNGIGIPEKDLTRIFEKGFTGANGRAFAKSTGIGLYLCYRLCKKMNLDLKIESKQNVGTIVMITFPKDIRVLFE